MSDRESQAPLGPGEVLAGKYRVERVLGAGGMGVVVQALHLELEERVAVKFLLPHALENAEAAARFVREARAAVRIKSEHVARVTDVGRLDNGSPYIVMEYLEGTDLSVVVQQQVLAVEDAVDFVLQACLAIAEAHAAGIVHRDLKPSNLFLARRPDGSSLVKVLDFGISKVTVTDQANVALTRTSTLMGSPLYMSPEQLRSARDVDHRTDIWSLGVILFELLTRSAPFQAETLPQLIATVISDTPPLSLAELRADVPPALVGVVMHCLERDPSRRFGTVGELAHALVPFASVRSRYITERLVRPSVLPAPGARASGSPSQLVLPSSIPPAPPVPQIASGSSGPGAAAGTASAWADTGARGARSSRALAVGAAAVALVGGIVGFVVLRSRAPNAVPERDNDVTRPAAVAPGTTVAPATAAPAPASPPPAVAPTTTPDTQTTTPTADSAASAAPSTSSKLNAHARPGKPDAPPVVTTAPAAVATAPAAAPTAPRAEAPKPPKNPLAVELK